MSTARLSTSDANVSMTKTSLTFPDDHLKNDNPKKKKSIIPKIFGSRSNGRGLDDDIFGPDGVFIDLQRKTTSRRKAFFEASPVMRKSFSERQTSSGIEGLNLERSMSPESEFQDYRIFAATWNVGGKTPNNGLNLEDFLKVEGSSDIYVLGFQEIVPLSAGNVLVIEDNEPAAKWLALISQALNRSKHGSAYYSSDSSPSSKNSSNSKDSKSHFFQKPSLKVLSKNFRAESSLLKSCNCPSESHILHRRRPRNLNDISIFEDFVAVAQNHSSPSSPTSMSYRLIASKQMVGIFLSVWARKELVQHIGHLRISCVGRGIMGCLRNKGCISISLSLHQTTLCFVCSHLASGEKEGDELKRNSDVIEILKCTQFPKICKKPSRPMPERIIDHDQIIWLGDLNYRVALSYDETRVFLEDNDWDSLLQKDQLNMEREAGRVFKGWSEGRILFAPTYKYSQNSDSYAGETVKSKKKRRTPAWCDRILWRGNGIEQLSYIRGESRFSDHRPVCAVFQVEVQIKTNSRRFRKGYPSCAANRLDFDECMPQRHSFYEF